MNKGKIILKATLELLSPLQIGSGRSDNCDKDVLLDADRRPYIPASSFIGKLNAEMNDQDFSKYMGIYGRLDKEVTQSRLIIDDLLLVGNPDFNVNIRDGIRIDNKTGIVEDGAKFDYQVVEPGLSFALNMEFDVLDDGQLVKVKDWIKRISGMLNSSFSVGARSSSGSGELKATELKVMCYPFDTEDGVIDYLLQKPRPNCEELICPAKMAEDVFAIKADYRIPSSLIVRSSPSDPFGSDAVHLTSNGKFVLPGSSLRGALRARAQRIVNLLWGEVPAAKDFIRLLFGWSGKEDGVHYTIPSSLMVNEVEIDKVTTELQNRIKIDRFTGGTIESALFDSMPLFPNSDEAQIKDLRLSIKDALPSQKGLLLLLFKDLYTRDLAIGGEKNVGRGCLKGIKNSVWDQGVEYADVFNQDDVTKWDEYIQALVNNSDRAEVENRWQKFMPKEGGKDVSNQ